MPSRLERTFIRGLQQVTAKNIASSRSKRGVHSLRTLVSTLPQRNQSILGFGRPLWQCFDAPWTGFINQQSSGPQTRSSSSSSREAKVICSTTEHSPGHNVATISISNPAKLNIVNNAILGDLIKTCQELSKDDELRAVVLTGAPTASGKPASFIGGADINEMSQMSSYEEAHAFITHVHNACDAFRQVPVPVIGRVHGFALGAGLEILATLDLRIATKDSTLGMPEVKIGLPSVIEAAYLPGLMGWGRARRFLYLAENISGTEAERWGLVEKVVDDEAALDKAVNEWVDMLVTMGPKCIRSQKRLMQKWERGNVDEAIQAGVEALAETFRDGGKEPRELMQGFFNRKR